MSATSAQTNRVGTLVGYPPGAVRTPPPAGPI